MREIAAEDITKTVMRLCKEANYFLEGFARFLDVLSNADIFQRDDLIRYPAQQLGILFHLRPVLCC